MRSIQPNNQEPLSLILAQSVKIKKSSSLYSSPKPIVILATALATSAAVALLLTKIFRVTKNECTDGFYDEFKMSICKNGKFESTGSRGFPDLKKYSNLIDLCAKNVSMSGCEGGRFYRHLTQECMDNPSAAWCDGKGDYQNFLDEVSLYSRPWKFSREK
jgi:hypothetical protein